MSGAEEAARQYLGQRPPPRLIEKWQRIIDDLSELPLSLLERQVLEQTLMSVIGRLKDKLS